MYRFSPGSSRMRWKPHSGGELFFGSGSAVYDGRCLLMNETARKLMKRIDDASFAMDDVILYLDTHPDDRNALNYYRYVVALRKEAVKAYEASFGPLTIEDADDACNGPRLQSAGPWEGRCSVCGDMKKRLQYPVNIKTPNEDRAIYNEPVRRSKSAVTYNKRRPYFQGSLRYFMHNIENQNARSSGRKRCISRCSAARSL